MKDTEPNDPSTPHRRHGGKPRLEHRRGHKHRPGDSDGVHGPRRRAPRGDVRAAALVLLDEEPMHGYQLMQAIADRSNGRWAPSPGAIYPTINQLEDEGLVEVSAESGRRLVTLTESGRAAAASTDDPFARYAGSPGPGADLRQLLDQLHDATRQIGRNGSEGQRDSAARVLAQARRDLYLLLADGTGDTNDIDTTA